MCVAMCFEETTVPCNRLARELSLMLAESSIGGFEKHSSDVQSNRLWSMFRAANEPPRIFLDPEAQSLAVMMP